MTITNRDWMGEPGIEEKYADEYSYIEFGGIQYSGTTTGTFSAFLACAPGAAPSFRGKVEKSEGLALGGQSQLNQMVGNILANRNSRYPTIDLKLTENLRNLDIAPQESARVIVAPSDTIRNISLDRLYVPDRITWKYDPQNKIMLPDSTLNNIVTGDVGESIIIPASPDDAIGGGFRVPGLQIPKLPSLTLPGGGSSPTGSSCCDDLNAPTSLCFLFLSKDAPVASTATKFDMRFEEIKDPSRMYNISNGRIDILVTGTYSVSMEAYWTWTDIVINPNQPFIMINCYNSAGAEKLNAGIPDPNYPDFLRIHVTSDYATDFYGVGGHGYRSQSRIVSLNAGDYFRFGKWLPNPGSGSGWNEVDWDDINIEISCNYA